MLTLDDIAFIEQIVVPIEDKRASRRRQRIGKAHVEVLQQALELRMLEQVLVGLERDLANGQLPPAERGRIGHRSSRGLDPTVVRSRVSELQSKLTAKKERASQLEQEQQSHEATLPVAKAYRLHSTASHTTYSEEQYQQLVVEQRETPVRLAETDGLTWWWFSDRFWWDDEGLRASEVAGVVHQLDRDLARRSDSSRRSLAIAAGDGPARTDVQIEIPELVRQAVWRRDQGRCVECGSDEEIAYDLIVPLSHGGSPSTPNVELRCSACL